MSHANQRLIHHLRIVACKAPGYRDPSGAGAPWHCGYNWAGHSADVGTLPTALPCAEPNDYSLYFNAGYDARDKGVLLPASAGVQVGAEAGYRTLVMTSHYPDHHNLTNGWTGRSGVLVKLSRHAVKKAGFLMVYT